MIDVKKINVIVPDGVQLDGEISLTGNIARVGFIATSTGSKVISANYDNGDSRSTTLEVVDRTILNEFTIEPTEEVFVGENITVTATFSRVPTLSDLVITVPIRFTEHTAPHIVGNSIVAVYTAPDIAVQNATISADYRNGEYTKDVKINVVNKPVIFQDLTTDKENGRVGSKVKVTATFDRQIENLEDIVFVPSEGLSISEPAKIEDNTVVIVYTGDTVGVKTVQATFGETEKSVEYEVLADAVIKTVVGEPEPVALAETVTITVTYDKARLEDQPVMDVKLDAGLAEKTPYSENPERTGGTMVVTAGESGDKTVTFTLGGVPKILKITVNG